MNSAHEPTISWKVRLNATLAARVELALMDTKFRKPRYGSRKQLLEQLLTDWLMAQAYEGAETE